MLTQEMNFELEQLKNFHQNLYEIYAHGRLSLLLNFDLLNKKKSTIEV